MAVSVYPQYIVLQQNITQSNGHNGLSTIHHTAGEHHTETGMAVSLSVYPQHTTYSQDLLQQNITQRNSNSRINLYIHTTSNCRRISCWDDSGRISLYTLHHTREEHHTEIQQQQYQCPQYILRQIITTQRDSNSSITISLSTLQKNITQRDSNGSITVSPSTIHCTAKEHHTKRRQRLYYYSSTVSVHPQNFVCKV